MNANRFDGISRTLASRLTRRTALTGGAAALAAGALSSADRVGAAQSTATPVATLSGEPAVDIAAIARDAMDRYDLKALILRVTVDGEEIITTALGESMTGVPATTDMHFRNGAVAIAYVATVMLRLVERGLAGLDDPIAKWLPDLPDADTVTLRMLANMTSGYNDYLRNDDFVNELYANPFRQWTAEERIDYGLAIPRTFAPGTNWDYSHCGYVILGRVLEQIGGKPLDLLLQEEVSAPLGLRNTVSSETALMPEPVLHSFSTERREALGIPDGTPFLEETTYWDPSWTISVGAVQTTDIYDMAASAVAIGEGTLLSPESHAAQVSTELIGFGSPLDGCPTCHTVEAANAYGLGVKLWGDWIVQDPTLAGYDEVMGYLPAGKIAIAVAVTYGAEAFEADAQGNVTYGSGANALFTAIGTYLAPDNAPPER
jgi:CubicO group peptidase (beta-lactamase class C family)